MRKTLWAVLALFSAALPSFNAAAQSENTGEAAEHRSCIQCHSLRLVESQRLSRAAWTKEIDKMIRWGADVPDRQLLLDYLAQQYSDAKPVPSPEHSADGRSHRAASPKPHTD